MSSAPASSAMLASALESTDSVTGSNRSFIGSPPRGIQPRVSTASAGLRPSDTGRALPVLAEHQRARVVDRPAPARPRDAGGLGELDHRRADHLGAGPERGPVEDVDLDPVAVAVRAPAARDSWSSGLGAATVVVSRRLTSSIGSPSTRYP